MKKNQPSKYGILNNSLFMAGTAWKNVPSVLYLTLAQALLAVGLSVAELYAGPAVLKNLETHAPLEKLLPTILIFTLCITGLDALTAYVNQNLMFGRCQVRECIIQCIMKKSSTCSYPLLEGKDFSQTLSKSMDAVLSNSSPAEDIWNTYAAILQNLLGFLIYLYLLSHADAIIIAVATAAAIAGYLPGRHLNQWGYRHRQEEAALASQFSYVEKKAGDRSLAKDVRIFGMESWLGGLLDKYLRLRQDFYMKRERVYLLADFTDLFLGVLRNGIAYSYLLHMALSGKLGAAEFLLYFSAVSGFTAWISGIMEGFSTLHKQSITLASIRELLDYPETFSLEEGIPLVPEAGFPYTIELKDVTFQYPGAEEPVFSHLNLTIHPGEKLAVVGLNGAGKTTLIKLACGFYDPGQGEVLLNGVNIKDYRRRDYYQLFAAVFQDFSLHAAGIGENVAQADENIDYARVWDCLEKAGMKEKISRLPQGISTHLVRDVYEDALEFSGGELQRLMLARLLYKNSPIIILDEPTAALDAIAESDIYQKYCSLAKGRTAVFISHRLASTRFCDRILLLGQGGIVEQGTHQELLGQKGAYARLFEIQSKYYREGMKKNDGNE